MSELLLKMLTGVLRVILVPVTTWLVSHDVLSSDETAKLIAELAGWAVAIGWTLYAWWDAKRREHTALALAPGATSNDVTDAIKKGNAAPAATPPDESPRLNRN